MTETWVINASPLILLGKMHRLDLLERLAAEVIVPQTVFNDLVEQALKLVGE